MEMKPDSFRMECNVMMLNNIRPIMLFVYIRQLLSISFSENSVL